MLARCESPGNAGRALIGSSFPEVSLFRRLPPYVLSPPRKGARFALYRCQAADTPNNRDEKRSLATRQDKVNLCGSSLGVLGMLRALAVVQPTD